MKLVLLGPPGAGKGTVSEQLIRDYDAAHISTGDMLRENVAAGTELGKLAKSYMDAGKLVPDDVIIGMVRERFTRPDCAKGFILDGFPRTVEQAVALDGITDIDLCIELFADYETIVERLSGRRVCAGCGHTTHKSLVGDSMVCSMCGGALSIRKDDNAEAIKERLLVYDKQTAPLVQYYAGKGILKRIDSNAPIDVRYAVVKQVIEAL